MQDPVYWVNPRHLAGDDRVLAERIGHALAGLGWRMWPTARNTLLYASPNELCGAEWILAAYPFELGGLPVAWQLSARSRATSAMMEWNAYFTTGVPHEVLADLLVAIDAREAPDVGLEGPETVLSVLSARGWVRDEVPQGTSVVDEIERHRKEFPPKVVSIEDRTNPRKPAWRHARLLYTSETGGAIRRGSRAKLWARNIKRANAYLAKSGSKVRVPEDTTLHDLRHFYASVLIKNGATPKQVQMRLGHAKPSITLNVYTHLWEAEADRTADMMEAVLNDVP